MFQILKLFSNVDFYKKYFSLDLDTRFFFSCKKMYRCRGQPGVMGSVENLIKMTGGCQSSRIINEKKKWGARGE